MDRENKDNKIAIKDLLEIAQQHLRLQNLQQELLDRVKAGDETAVPLLVDSWEPIVVNIASNYQNKGLSMEQMIAFGKEGLTKAALRDFGSTRQKSELVSFGGWWAKQEILRGLENLKICQPL